MRDAFQNFIYTSYLRHRPPIERGAVTVEMLEATDPKGTQVSIVFYRYGEMQLLGGTIIRMTPHVPRIGKAWYMADIAFQMQDPEFSYVIENLHVAIPSEQNAGGRVKLFDESVMRDDIETITWGGLTRMFYLEGTPEKKSR